ncbi:MAG: hypothetical protein NC127_08145 [Muribaculum sp.]|nr:hypothetical protein [Muribaculum sp.]
MNPLLETLKALLEDSSAPVDSDWSDKMARTYPYLVLPSILELQRNRGEQSMTEDRRRVLVRRIALNSSSAEMLYRITEPLGAELADFYPEAPRPETPSTECAIDTFMDKYGGGGDSHEEAILEKLIFNPVADYAQILASEEERSLPDSSEAEGDSQDSLINAFIIKSRNQQGRFPSPEDPLQPEPRTTIAETSDEPIQPPIQQDDSLLSESLAKIYIKQRRYAKAFEIITNLSLKYPEKSIYFADQLRFLQKLIINQKYQNKKITTKKCT